MEKKSELYWIQDTPATEADAIIASMLMALDDWASRKGWYYEKGVSQSGQEGMVGIYTNIPPIEE